MRQNSNTKKSAYLFANLAVVGFAAAAIIGKKANMDAAFLVWGRTFFAAITIGLLLLSS